MFSKVDPHSPVPPSQQLVAAALDAIASGALAAGDKLPSVRGLAAQVLVNPNTVTKAYRDLEHLGATEGRNGSGVYVTADGPEVAKGIRLSETLQALRQAMTFARRAGHERVVVDELLREVWEGPVDGGHPNEAQQAEERLDHGKGAKVRPDKPQGSKS